jgi:hypothetical protein
MSRLRLRQRTIIVGSGAVSPIALSVNMPELVWFGYLPAWKDTAYSAPGNTSGEWGGFTGSTTGNPIPDANRDANGFVKSVPGGEAGISFVCQLPPSTVQRRLSWTSKLGGTAHGINTITMTSGGTSPSYNLTPGGGGGSVTYTPTNIADGSSSGVPAFTFTPVSSTDYPINFIDRPVTDDGAVLNSEFTSLIPAACSSSPILRFMKDTSAERNNSPIWQGQSSQPATSVAGKTISSITFVGTLATVTTSTAHGLLGNGTGSSSASITLTGATPSTYNVADRYVKVISPTQFQYTTFSSINISSLTFSGTTATLTTATAHGLTTGATVSIIGAQPNPYNVTNVTITVTSTTTFTYTMSSNPGTNATSVGAYAVAPTGNATVMGSYMVGDFDFQFTNLHYPSVGSEPGTQFGEPIYTSANRNKNKTDLEWHDGLMVESQTQLCASASAHLWYNAAWNADSTFYADVATVCATFAATNSKDVYLEVSNEVWNSGYRVTHQAINEANLRGTLGDALPACRLIATSNITLSGAQNIDGMAVVTNDRILVIGQTTASQNGVYLANTAGAWTRASDTIVSRSIWLVTSGLTYAQTSWFVSTAGPITLGTTSFAVTQIDYRMRHAEKSIEVANAFITAFAGAGVSTRLKVVVAWQYAGSTNNWDAMALFLGATDWAKVTHLAIAPYYGDQEPGTALYAAGIDSTYTGSTATLKAALVTDINDVVNQTALHMNKAISLGKKLITYEAGNTVVLDNLAYKQAWARSSDAYDIELRFLQQMELKVASLQTGGFWLTQFSLAYPLVGGSFSWGLIEGITQTRSLATTPKLKAHTDFLAGTRVLSDQIGTFQIPVGAVNGSVVGTAIHSALNSTFSLSNSSSGLFAINSTTGVVTVANAGLYTAGSSYTLSIDEALVGVTTHTTTFSVPALAGNTTAYRYYRIYTTDPVGLGGFGAAEIELSETVGGTDTTAGQTYTSSTNFSGQTPDKAFDDNVGTEFNTDFSGAQPYWIKVDYGATSGNWKKINQVKYTAPNAYNHAPTDFKLQGSTDNFATSIVDIITVAGQTWTSINEVKTFTT